MAKYIILSTAEAIRKLLKITINNNLKLKKIMSKLDELKIEVTELRAQSVELQSAVDLEQEQIAALLATNAQVVATLSEQIAILQQRPTEEQLAEVITEIQGAKDTLATTKADIEATVPEPPPEEG